MDEISSATHWDKYIDITLLMKGKSKVVSFVAIKVYFVTSIS